VAADGSATVAAASDSEEEEQLPSKALAPNKIYVKKRAGEGMAKAGKRQVTRENQLK
jgi:hypothetical protein